MGIETVTATGTGPRAQRQLDEVVAGNTGIQVKSKGRSGATHTRTLTVDADSHDDARAKVRDALGQSAAGFAID